MSEFIYKRERIADGIYSAESTGEEIVRCRDCRCFRKMSEKQLAKRPSAKGWCVRVDIDARPDGYCAWCVKRKEGGDD